MVTLELETDIAYLFFFLFVELLSLTNLGLG